MKAMRLARSLVAVAFATVAGTAILGTFVLMNVAALTAPFTPLTLAVLAIDAMWLLGGLWIVLDWAANRQ